MKDLKEIAKFPTVIDNNHESLYRSYQILNQVLNMLERGDSQETILEVVRYLQQSNMRIGD